MYYPMIPTDAIAYHEGRIRENKHLYLVSAARLARPRLHARFLAGVGRVLTFAGTRLRERYEPAFAPGPEVSAAAAAHADC
jgi:hypothetical protein